MFLSGSELSRSLWQCSEKRNAGTFSPPCCLVFVGQDRQSWVPGPLRVWYWIEVLHLFRCSTQTRLQTQNKELKHSSSAIYSSIWGNVVVFHWAIHDYHCPQRMVQFLMQSEAGESRFLSSYTTWRRIPTTNHVQFMPTQTERISVQDETCIASS